ncbi:MAG TPA: radical SAM protein [Candidatus Aquilonibacter sp.]|nr:radical SAM protein [Candidatus Aquilonibacter sp.]
MTALPLPRFIQIEPVGECNLRCRMCPIQFRRDGRPHGPAAFMEFDLFTEIVRQFPDLRELQLQGLGEPLMHPRFFDMVRYARARGVTVSVNTNLTFLTPKAAAQCIASGLSRVHASLDGATKATYERIRVRANYHKSIRNLKRLLDERSRRRSSTPYVEIVAVAMRENLEELPVLVEQAAAWGVDAISVQHLCHDFREASLPAHYRPMRAFVESQTLVTAPRAAVDDAFTRARDAADRSGIRLRLPNLDERPARDPRGCGWPSTGAYFSFRGEIMPCCMISTPDRFNFGNVREEPFERTWNGARYGRFRAQLASGKPPDICSSCAVYTGTF